MTAPDPRVGEIEDRLSKAPGAQGLYSFHAADIAYLLAELRDRDEKLARVEGLADMWTKRGEHDMAYSKTIPDEDIAMAILTDGANKVENARHIRNALRAAVAAAGGGGGGDRG